MIDFLIIYEHKVRELECVCLLKAELEIRGYVVEVLNINDCNRLRYRFDKKPHVIVTFAMYDDICFKAHAMDIVGGHIKKIVNLQWEQLYSQRDIECRYVIPSGAASLVTHICWGEDSQTRLIRSGARHACITGAIQMDFLRAPLNKFFCDRETIQKKYCLPNNQWILYISSFAFASMTDEEIRQYDSKILGGPGDHVRTAIVSRRETLSWFKKLLTENSDYTLIYRPHPAEHVDETLLEMERLFRGFRIIHEESVKQWILTCDVISTWYSTSVSEIFFSGRNYMILRPVPIPSDIDVLIMRNGKFVETYDTFYSELKNSDSDFKHPIPASEFEKYYDNKDFLPSYIRICNLLDEVYHTSHYDISDAKVNKYYLGGAFKSLAKQILLCLGVSEKTWPLNRCKYIYNKLIMLSILRENARKEIASTDEINVTTQKIKGLISAD